MGGQSQGPGAGDRAIADLADRQHGAVARRQLLTLGITARMVERRLASGRLIPVHRGVYAVGHRLLTLRGRWLAAVLACGPNSVLSHGSAAALWGIAKPGPRIEVAVDGGRRRPGILVHCASLVDAERTRVDGIPVTAVPRTLIDLAATLPTERLERAWEEADRLGLLGLVEIERASADARGRPGTAAVRRLIADAFEPSFTRSSLEDAFVAFCRRRELPMPRVNFTVLGQEVDAFWPGKALVVELDGYAFHRHRAAFERDRARDAALQAAGMSVLRITFRRLRDDPDGVETEIRRLLAGR
jgi:very-short-patch-repair endonuclease